MAKLAGPRSGAISTRCELENLLAKRRHIILFTPCTLFYTILKFLWNLRCLELLLLVPPKTKVNSASVYIYIYFHRRRSHEIETFALFFLVFRIFRALIDDFFRMGGLKNFCGTVIVSSK